MLANLGVVAVHVSGEGPGAHAAVHEGARAAADGHARRRLHRRLRRQGADAAAAGARPVGAAIGREFAVRARNHGRQLPW